MIKETDPPIIVHVDNGTGMNNNHFSLLGDNNITEDLQKDDRLSEWFTAEETSCMNDSINLINVDNSTVYTKGNAYGIIYIPIIESTFENDYIHILHYLSN